LTRDPRARRAALAARRAGHEVEGLCARIAGDSPRRLEGIRLTRVGGDRFSEALRSAGLGGIRRAGPFVRELRGLYRLARLFRLTLALFRAGKGLGRFDILHANDLDTLPAAALLARKWRACLIYDAHELYSSQEPDPPRLHGLITGALEAILARRCDAVVTVCEPIADELGRRLRLARPAVVVLNCPEREELPSRRESSGPLRVVYQGAMGPGRPLDDLLVGVERAEGVVLTIRVIGTSAGELLARVARRGLADRVSIAEPVAPDRLVETLVGFDVGLIINRPVTRNDEYVLPNKLFEYMMAGVVPVVPRLPALAPIVEGEGIGVAFEPGRPDLLGAVLSQLAADRASVRELGQRARRLAVERYNAERQADVLTAVWEACPAIRPSG
jgi:glycogen synthase